MGLSVSPVIQGILASLIAVVVSVSTALAGVHTADNGVGEAGNKRERDDLAEESRTESRGNTRRAIPALLDPVPVMFMIVGLACGATVGVYGRSHNWLGAKSNILVEEWKDTGLSSKEITSRVFDSLYPPTTSAEGPNHEPAHATPTPTTDPSKPAAGIVQPTVKPDTKVSEAQSARSPAAMSSFRDGVLFSVSLDQCKRLANAEGEDELRREMASSNSDALVNLAKTCRSYECLRAGVHKACAKYK